MSQETVLVCREMFRVPVVKEQLKKPLGLEQDKIPK